MKLKLPVLSFGWNKKSQKGSESASASAPPIADEADNIEDIRDDVVRPKEIEAGQATDAIAEELKANDSSKQEGDADPHDDPAEDTLESKASDTPSSTAGPIETVAAKSEMKSLSSVPNASPTFFGRMKKAAAARAGALPAVTVTAKESFGRIKKFKKGTPSSKASSVENDIAVEKALETKDSAHEEDSVESRVILETKDSVQQEGPADVRDDTPLESANLPAKKEEQAVVEVPSASEGSLKEKEDIVEDKRDVTEVNEEASAKEVEAPAMEAKESRDDQPSIEAVQMDGAVALGFFSSKGQTMNETDDLLAQTRQFAESAALIIEQSCLTPCSGHISLWQANVTPKVQEWQATVVPMVQELQSKIFPAKLTTSTTEAATAAPEMTSEEEDRNDSTLDEKSSLVEDSHYEVRVM